MDRESSASRGVKREREESNGETKLPLKVETTNPLQLGEDAPPVEPSPSVTPSKSSVNANLDKDAYTALSKLSAQARDTGVKLKRVADRTKQVAHRHAAHRAL